MLLGLSDCFVSIPDASSITCPKLYSHSALALQKCVPFIEFFFEHYLLGRHEVLHSLPTTAFEGRPPLKSVFISHLQLEESDKPWRIGMLP